MRRFAAVLFLAACAHRSTTQCDRFTGLYALDTGSCRDSRGVLPLTTIDVWKFPDGSAIEPAVIGIHQEDCDRASFVIRGRPGFEVETHWENGALVHAKREWSNFPPPIAIGAHGAFYWTLRRKPDSGDLLYTSGYYERGLFFLIPYNAHREMTCTLTRQR